MSAIPALSVAPRSITCHRTPSGGVLVSDIRNTMGVSPLAQPMRWPPHLGVSPTSKTYQDSRHVTSNWRWVVQIARCASLLWEWPRPVVDPGQRSLPRGDRRSPGRRPAQPTVACRSRPRRRLGLSSNGRREDFAVLRLGWSAFAVALVATSAVSAAEPMAPSEIQATFFTGQAFTATTPSGTKFKMTFTPDGKMAREPLPPTTKGNAPKSAGEPLPPVKGIAAKSAERSTASTGIWKLNAKGFCTTWAHSKPRCFTIVPNGENKWSIQRIATTIATTVSVWSK